MSIAERLNPMQAMILVAIIGLALFFIGFWLARSTAEKSLAAERTPQTERSRYQYLQVGDTIAAIDVVTGEAFAIDGNTRAWTILAPALPSKETKPVK
jgi:Co/Zn/Cd efflux system component